MISWGERVRDIAAGMVRSRFLRGLAVGVLLTLAALTLVTSYLWGQALQPECAVLQRADLTLEEMVDVKLKVDASEREGSSEIVFTGREASFLVREVLRLPVFIDVRGDELVVQAVIPRREQCYNIDFRGGVTVDDGVAVLRPTLFQVGDLDLAGWIDEELVLRPEVLKEAGADGLMSHLQRLEVHQDEVTVKVDDVGALR